MRTIVEPKQHIVKLWGKQGVREDGTYRLMKYVLRVDHEGKVLLHNVVTGQLVVLDQDEAKELESLPTAYNPVMEQLVAEHYLVPEDYNEHQQVKNLQSVLRRLDDAQCYPGITTYTILTTTACNARCYYCYEKGSKIVTMTEQTADEVVNFINNHCGPKKRVFLVWFGGEPTLASNRITRICNGLQQIGIQYLSIIVTNGYLFDEQMVSEAKDVWKLKFAQICVDGIEERYNDIKSYVGVVDNPYQRVMRNIKLLLDAGIRVKLRMNFDIGNYQDFRPLTEEIKERFQDNSLLQVSAHPIIGAYPDRKGNVLHGSDEWFKKAVIELDDIMDNAGLMRRTGRLPSLDYRMCMAARDQAVTITPEGFLVRCPEQMGTNQVTGSLKDGITNQNLVQSWKRIAEYEKCTDCVLFPRCVTIINCLTSEKCILYGKQIKEISAEAVWLFQSS